MNKMRAMMFAGVSQCIIANAFADTPIDPVVEWNANAGAAAIKACISPDGDPFHESRMYAMMHLAIHDALNAIDRRFQPHAYDKKADPGTSSNAAVAAAAHTVLIPLIRQLPAELLSKPDCIDNGVASVEAAYTAAINAIPDSPTKMQGIALGQATAAAILVERTNDHSNDRPFLNKNCPPSGQPGAYQCTPGFPFVAFEKWDNVTPFVLQDNAQYRPGVPLAVTDAKFKVDLEEVKSLGGDGKTTPSARTPDQTQIALFWWESSPLKWSRIARTVAVTKGLNPWENARLFAMLNMALTDGYIAMVSAKNQYNFWRPVTAIHNAGDQTWTPLRPTPPNQDYPSGHAIEGGAGAEVLAQVFGDQISFQDCGMEMPDGNTTCDDPKPTLRSFTSFSQAAIENGYSRVLVGFHFHNATDVGTAYGHKIGERAATLLQPVR
jgi:membrane-associated phospholipid phosphatase